MKEASVKKDTEDQNKRRKIRIHFLKKTKLTGLIILPLIQIKTTKEDSETTPMDQVLLIKNRYKPSTKENNSL